MLKIFERSLQKGHTWYLHEEMHNPCATLLSPGTSIRAQDEKSMAEVTATTATNKNTTTMVFIPTSQHELSVKMGRVYPTT